jgi:hypothetical protein
MDSNTDAVHPRRSGRLGSGPKMNYNIVHLSRQSIKRAAEAEADNPRPSRRPRVRTARAPVPAQSSEDEDDEVSVPDDDGSTQGEAASEDEQDPVEQENNNLPAEEDASVEAEDVLGEDNESAQDDNAPAEEGDAVAAVEEEEPPAHNENNQILGAAQQEPRIPGVQGVHPDCEDPNYEFPDLSWMQVYQDPTSEEFDDAGRPGGEWEVQLCPHPVNAFFLDSRPRRPRPRPQRRILHDIVWDSDRPPSMTELWTQHSRPSRDSVQDITIPGPVADFDAVAGEFPREMSRIIFENLAPRLIPLHYARYPALWWRMPEPSLALVNKRFRGEILHTQCLVGDQTWPDTVLREKYVEYEAWTLDKWFVNLGFFHRRDIIMTWPMHPDDHHRLTLQQNAHEEERRQNPDRPPGPPNVRTGADMGVPRSRRRFHCRDVIRDLGTETIFVPAAKIFRLRDWERVVADGTVPVPAARFASDFARWGWLADVPSVKTIYVDWTRGRKMPGPLRDGRILSARVDWEAPEQLTQVDMFPMLKLVDLFDDQAMAEMISLESEPSGCKTPHWLRERTCRPRLCVHCARLEWTDKERIFLSFYMIMRYMKAHPGESIHPILTWTGRVNVASPFVREVQKSMPEIKPCMMFSVLPRKNGMSDWYDLCSEAITQTLLPETVVPEPMTERDRAMQRLWVPPAVAPAAALADAPGDAPVDVPPEALPEAPLEVTP